MSGILGMQAYGMASILKPVLLTGILFLWARWATLVDKDAMYYNQKRRMWNLIQLTALLVGFLPVLFIPIYPVGLLVGLLIVGGAGGAYVIVRNKEVPEDKRWRFDKDTLIDMIQERRAQKELKKAVVKFASPPAGLTSVPLPEDVNREAHLLFEQVLENALRRKAQKFELSGSDRDFQVKLQIDGVDYAQGKLPAVSSMSLIDYVKAQSSLDVSNRRKMQIGKCEIQHEELGDWLLGIHTWGSTRGLSMLVELNPEQQRSIPLEQMGLLERQAELIKPLLEKEHGLVLVASPPHEGRTTTLYGLVETHDAYTLDIHTIEKRVERHVEGVKQKEVPESEEVGKNLHTILLRDPQTLMIDDPYNQDVARQLAAGADEEGTHVYVGIVAKDAFTAIEAWTKLVDDRKLATENLIGVVGQRLLRKLCSMCRQEYVPDDGTLKKLNLSSKQVKKFYKSSGQLMVRGKPEPCPNCGGIGYLGRISAFEVLPIDEEGREALRAGDIEKFRTQLRRQKVFWLQEAALTKAVAGMTSLSELSRVFSGQKAEASAE